ncbi:IclR family transcriptional regulator [Caldalkalibacillus salinus]|uniref:IclR family transcriptional regulator n=1 Tax=Caldalkalibacillus salinus TaxID=2803787 RepID=UPI001922E60D|nr:IclR family transcriptional regulator [Caldalkalibacillus salinus]
MIQSVDRALKILELLKDHPQGLGVTELANRFGVAKSTIHRLLMTLEHHQYIQQDETQGTYQLGLKFLEMNEIVVGNLDIVRIARPVLERLSEEAGEISHLVMLDQDEILYIDKVETSSTIRIYSQTGKRAPLYCTGVGKAIIAHIDHPQQRKLVDKMDYQPYTKHTICDRESLLIELDKIKSQGYAEDNEEHELGIRCIAAPIFDHEGRANYAVSVTGPLTRMSDNRIEALIPKVKEAALQVSRKLGYHSSIS